MTQPRNLDDLFPLSPMQHLMLLHSLTAAHQGALVNQACYEIRGPLHADAFARAWEALVARHPALRTAFLWEGLPKPLQAVRRQVALPFRTIDLADVPAREQARRLDDLRREDAAAPMPLARAPLMRCTLARLADDRHHFIWSVHHLVVDRWSHGILFSDLRVIYDALLRGEEADLPPAHGFREYVAWLSGQEAPQAAERYWREELLGFTEPTLLSGAGLRPTSADRRTTRRTVDAATAAALRTRAASWRTTLAALILSGVGVAFARRFGRDDVLCGLAVSGRPPDLACAESIVGSFVSNVPARLRLDPARPLADWVRGVQRDQARRLPFEHASPRDIREWAELPYPHPLFDTLVLLNVADAPEAAWADPELRLVSATLDAGHPLLLAAGPEGPDLALTLVHDASFGDADPVLAEVARALEALAAAPPEATVGDLVPGLARRAAPAPVAPAPVAPAPVAPAPSDARDERRQPVRSAGATGADADPASADALLRLWRDVLGVDVGLDDDFFALGGTSLQALELFVRMERLLGRGLPVSTLFRAGSVRGLLAELGQPVRHPGSLVRIRSGGARPPIVAVAGVNVVGMAGLARVLGPGQPFLALESPGLDGREAPLTTIEATAHHFVAQLLPAVAGPFHLLGFCWGAAVAFEMARQLRAVGRAPRSLALVDPAVLLRRTASGGVSPETQFVLRRLELYWEAFRDADWRERGRFLAGKVRRAAGVIAGDEARTLRQAEFNRFRVESASREAITRYLPQRYCGQATMFLSSGSALGGGGDARLEWRRLIEPAPEIVYVPGVDSGDVISPAHLDGFAATLRDRLDASTAPPASE